jgi:predicted nicotinamide N-methyase
MHCLSSLLCSSLPSEATSAQQKSYVTYTISTLSSKSQAENENTPTTTLLEARNLVAAAGTTGLRTWEAALHLGNYLCANSHSLVKGKSILELGAGTGYVSILCAEHLGASHVLATDGSDDVVSSLSTNFYLNNLQDSSKIEGKELKWGHALIGAEHPEWNGGRKIDLVLGADLTYDGSGIPALVSTFRDLFHLYPEVKIIIAATVRNPRTFQTFLGTCRGNGYVVEEIEFGVLKAEQQQGPFYSGLVPIQLCLITKP